MKISNVLYEFFRPWEVLRRIKRISLEGPATRMDSLFLMGQIAARTLPKDVQSIQDAEFRVFSQFGEDGIIQYLVRKLGPHLDRSFIEFGVQNYLESNTLFLMMNNGWRGLVLDGEEKDIEGIRRREFSWKYGLKSECMFVSRDNINDIFREQGFADNLGLLSIDVDGVDWHLWNALTVVRPAIVITEYNRNLPIERAITVPYTPVFDRTKQRSIFYYGASLSAMALLGKAKGYRFVGVERHQRNAFFVREDLAGDLPSETVRAEFVDKEARSVLEILKGLPVYDVETSSIEVL